MTAALGLCAALLLAPASDHSSGSAGPPQGRAGITRDGRSPLAASVARAQSGRTAHDDASASAGVAGRVLDAAGRPVAGAVILIRALATETPVAWPRAITDAAGNFRVAGLLPGFYSLVALHDQEHTSATERLPLLADATARVLIVLSEPITL